MSVFHAFIDEINSPGGSIGHGYRAFTHAEYKEIIREGPCKITYCVDCQHSWYAIEEQANPLKTYIAKPSDYLAQKIIKNLVETAAADREYLLNHLASNGNLIVSKWKKSVKKREEILKRAVPDIHEKRWTIVHYSFEAESKTTKTAQNRSMVWRHRLLLPWLNLEILKENPAVLFALLHNRTAYPPQDWAAFDSKQLVQNWAIGFLAVQFSAKCVVMHGSRYGQVVDFEAGATHRGDTLGFPRAQLVLEAQAYLMNSLRKTVDLLLEGADLSTNKGSDKWESMTGVGFKHSNHIELWSPYTNQPFCPPPVFKIDNLVSIAQTRLDALGDHLFFLQTDPAYLRRFGRIVLGGAFGTLQESNGQGTLLASAIIGDVVDY
ncbi:hypothetical protein G7Y89_g10330 [Cudoniella acicularis]|uniref:Uncharacterized protein n=1 Tax=Cudoniella acicularis TaxID=354080 RepID=A0A8H4W130_9HELO|nr:hypothetical protein G7Y89_g10330 [Cudoniella acicularis]